MRAIKSISIYLSIFLLSAAGNLLFAQATQYINSFDYQNINRQTFVPVAGFNDTQNHHFTILKHSFELQRINSFPADTQFVWNGLNGNKTFYSKDSLVLFFVRPNDTICRPCILITHGNAARYRSSWNEQTHFFTIDLVMRGFCVAYYENTSSFESVHKYASFNGNSRKAFYNGFQSAVAANIYITQHAADLHIDMSRFFASGYSFGGFCSLSSSVADTGKNFTDTLFAAQGNFMAKAIYPLPFQKNINRAFVIGGGLPKDDTIAANNSRMGNFIDSNDNDLSILFLHGYNDYVVNLDVTKFGTADVNAAFFYAEGPRALINNIARDNLSTATKLVINCKGSHPFISTVCGDAQDNCIQQYQWLYLTEPPNGVTPSHPYFTIPLRDTLLAALL